MASALNEESVEKKLKTVNNTQDSIQTLSLWIIHHKSHHARICQLWMKVLKKTVQPSHRLTLFYLCNDVVQNCKKKASVYNSTFREHLREAACLVRDVSVKMKVERIFNIWAERNVYDVAFVKTLHDALNGKSSKSKKSHKAKKAPVEEVYNGPISPVPSPVPPEEGAKGGSPPPELREEEDEEESARILAEFKPHEMIEQITTFTRQATDIKFKLSQITHLKLHDMSSAEAVKRLKDRSHGNDFSNQFEDSCNKLAELVKRQKQHLEDQKLLLQTLNTSETFYEEQYREAKIVANAYKNFGARINNIKKKLDELKKTFPQPPSPVPSPDVNAPSPGNTPPYLAATFNAAQQQSAFNNSAWYNGATSAANSASAGQVDSDLYNASPPLEAPSPEGSPPDLNLGNSDSASGSLESRLANFFNQGRPTSTASTAVYTPQLPASLAAAKLSTKQTVSLAPVGGPIEEDGSTTPLDDEAPTTPVQDEVSLSSPPPSKALPRTTPPKKENPIDFLSRLISQTQKGNNSASTKTGAASFLDSLTMLSSSSTVKKPDTPAPVPTVVPPVNSQTPWKSWPTEPPSPSNAVISPPISNNVSSSSSVTFTPNPPGPLSLPSSPLQFPQAVPPPIPLPVPPPPMALNINLNVPPPPPPPFLTSAVPPPDFSSPPPPPPMFQQTSPGQKENWPEVKPINPDLSHPQSADMKPRLADPDAMEIVSDEDEASLGIGGSTSDAGSEFANKLRQKTQAGSLKSSVYVPNPERPNLMTLTSGGDDPDLEDISEKGSVTGGSDEKTSWKKSRKSRSRSKSREKERSHRHKKKKKHKRSTHSDDEDFRQGDGGKSYSNIGSSVRKVSSRSSRDSRDSKGDKYDDDRRYDKYGDRDRKYDRYDDHKHHKSSRSADGGDGGKDNVEAYTQAYRNALLQQFRFNAPPSFPPADSDSRHYSKY